MAQRVAFVVLFVAAITTGCGSNSPTASSSAGTVFRQGSLTIPQTDIASLDTGALVSNPSAASDVWFDAATATDWFFSSMGAPMAIMGTSAPGYSGCSTARLSTSRFPMSSLSVGLYLCAKTINSRYVEIRVVQVPTPQPPGVDATLTITYTTFNN